MQRRGRREGLSFPSPTARVSSYILFVSFFRPQKRSLVTLKVTLKSKGALRVTYNNIIELIVSVMKDR